MAKNAPKVQVAVPVVGKKTHHELRAKPWAKKK
jgi:hypothetical protein